MLELRHPVLPLAWPSVDWPDTGNPKACSLLTVLLCGYHCETDGKERCSSPFTLTFETCRLDLAGDSFPSAIVLVSLYLCHVVLRAPLRFWQAGSPERLWPVCAWWYFPQGTHTLCC